MDNVVIKISSFLKRKWHDFVIALLLFTLIWGAPGSAIADTIRIQPPPALDDLTDVNATSPNDKDVLTWDAGLGEWINDATVAGHTIDIGNLQNDLSSLNSTISGNITVLKNIAIVYVIDGGDSEIADGQKGHLDIPFDCTITGWTLLADQSGSIVIDVWKDTYANFPPTVADNITGSEKPTLSSVQKNQDTNLTTWTTSVSAGDILAFNIDSCTTVTRITATITATRVV